MISVSSADIGELELRYANEAVASGRLSHGAWCERFESSWASRVGAEHGISCCNGTAALELALLACGVGEGTEVIVPTLTYAATASAVRNVGAMPVFVGSTPYGCIDPRSARNARTARTAAIVAVHLYGHPADVHGLPHAFVIEDAAEAHGARYFRERCGSLADAAAWSFYGNKILTTGEGGMVTTCNEKLAERARLLRGQGVDPERRFWQLELGHNYRLGNVQGAIGCAQVERFDQLLERRAQVFRWYQDRIGELMPTPERWARPAPWLVSVHVQERDQVAARLAALGVETRPWFPLVHTMPPYRGCRYLGDSTAAKLSATGLNLPTSSLMTEDDVARVCDALKEAMS